MNKFIPLSIAVSLISVGTGCSSANNGLNPNNYRHQSYELSNRSEPGNAKNPWTKGDSDNGRYGYVRVHQGPDGRTPGKQPTLDFEDLADKVSRLAVNLPNVYDVATLVTSRAALIGYQTDSDHRKLTAHQVKSAAMSVLPRFYHVYLTDDPTLIKKISRFRELSPNADVNKMLEATIRDMKSRSPQGPDMGPNENPNGEPKNGTDTITP